MHILAMALAGILRPKSIGIDDCGCETCTRIKLATIREEDRPAGAAPDWALPFQAWNCKRCGYTGTPHMKHCRECAHEKGAAQQISTCSPSECIPLAQCPVCTEADPYALLRAIHGALAEYMADPESADVASQPGGVELKAAIMDRLNQVLGSTDLLRAEHVTLSLYLPQRNQRVLLVGLFSEPSPGDLKGRRSHGSGKSIRLPDPRVAHGAAQRVEHGITYDRVSSLAWKLRGSCAHPCDTYDPDQCVCSGRCSCHWVRVGHA